jgi:hypothetical protein
MNRRVLLSAAASTVALAVIPVPVVWASLEERAKRDERWAPPITVEVTQEALVAAELARFQANLQEALLALLRNHPGSTVADASRVAERFVTERLPPVTYRYTINVEL